MSIKILIAEPDDFCPAAAQRLRDLGHVTFRATDREEMRTAFQEFDVIWFRLAHRIDADILGTQPRCRVLATPVTGLDHIDLAACRERGIEVVSLKGEVEFLKTVRATAELTLALTLALLRNIPAASRSVLDGVWNRDLFRGRELFGKTVGIIGLGRLGTITAGYFRAFGMRVIAYDPRPDFDDAAAERVASLDDVLRQADVVSVHVNYETSTRHLLGAKQFALMKPGSILINTSRGGVVEEHSLMVALASGAISGAALDVLDGEPHIDGTHPLIVFAAAHPQLLIVPHIGGNTRESFEKTESFLAGRVIDALHRSIADISNERTGARSA